MTINNFHNLPKNWQVKTLAEVCTSKNSNIVLRDIENNTGEYPIYGAKGFLKTIDFYTIEIESLGIVKDGAVGKIFLLPPKSSVIGTMAYIQANENLNLKYLYYFLQTINFNQYISGSVIPHIYFRDYKKEKIPLPPLETQKAIVEKLENAFAHIDEAVRHLKSVQTNIPRLKSSLLHCAFSGKLTESQNSSHKVQTLKKRVVGEEGETSALPLHPLIKEEIPQGWEVKTLGEVCEFVYGKALNQTKRKTNGKYPVYAANGIKDYSDEFMISENSIIVGRKGSVGSVVLTSSPCWVLDVAYYVNFDKEKYNLVFLYHLLKYLNLKQFARGVKPGISRSQIYELQVVMPPLATQNQIVQILESKFTHLDNLAQFVNASLENLQKLKSSLLNQAFKGELIC
ncbi:restriction endonuclease subunit S [Helicobacter sp. MIT 03-1614]|uniref:restriction endonuclease subunit S n=1 Tax=Helicobacter sp. MIT 03-1614 TaxID=1548147 RepID=UPI00068EEE0B|nr:restriction endonuclease subunit S [Helicobacter sp. MIT 03-1614]TLD87170.1 restriction endonuclease subunit S [Helicobacter sp. MIT 03-1614]